MNLSQSSWMAELTQGCLETMRRESHVSAAAWEITQDPATAVSLARIAGKLYRIVHFESLGGGFSLGLLGADYERVCSDKSWPAALHARLEEEKTRSRYYLATFRPADRAAPPFPLLTLMQDQRGNWHLLETRGQEQECFWMVFTVLAQLLAERTEDPARFDQHGDFQVLGAPGIVQRHSTERLQKHIAQRVVYDQRLCTHCLRCVTACNEMRAVVSDAGTRVLGPSEDFCTNCGLCQKRCSFLTARVKEEFPSALDPRLGIHEGGAGIHLYGSLARSYCEQLGAWKDRGAARFPYEIQSLLEVPAASRHLLPITGQIRLMLRDRQELAHWKPLLVTSLNGHSPLEAVVVRSLCRAALVLQTENGEVEKELARAAMKLGIHVMAVAEWESAATKVTTAIGTAKLELRPGDAETGEVFPAFKPGDLAIPCPVNETTRLFDQMGQWRRESLLELWQNREVDLFLAPVASQIPAELQQRILEETGRLSNILSPHIIQALPLTRSPLLGQLNAELTEIFMRHPELLEREASYARDLLQDIPLNHALIHARYRPMAIASGHTACPTCAEAMVLAIPIYMAIAMSLARKEIPGVSFTCETGCMSETLSKVNEVAQKVPGGRTVFGGGFAFGEAIAMAQDRAVRMGHLQKGRRYVVSQGGDGGAVIGLPAWLNALRQQAFLIRQRHPNVLHFINITDTQVYSNTGGESSATSLLGMGTLTTPIGKFLLGNQNIQWTLINLAAEFPGILVGAGHSGNRIAMQEFWRYADQLGQSAMRWDITPCPETGKFFGEDPDDLAEVMAHAGMIPEIVFVGRFRKRIAPFHPDDRSRPYREWRREPKPILYWLERDPRYRALLQKNPQTGKSEPRNLVAHFLITQLESFRDQLNWQIDLETAIVHQAEEWVKAFLDDLHQSWKHYRYRLEQFPYAMLFNRQGELKPEYRVSLEQELLQRILGWDDLARYTVMRDQYGGNQQDRLQDLLTGLSQLEKITEQFSNTSETTGGPFDQTLARIETLVQALGKELETLREAAKSLVPGDLVEQEIFARDERGPSADGEAAVPPVVELRRKDLFQLLERILEERGLAKQAELQQHRLAQQLKEDFLQRGGLIRATHCVASAAEREELRQEVRRRGPFAVGVASLAGDRGIAINRIFAHFFTAKGAWAGMAWQFGSSKRGTPVLSATFVDARPLYRKDAMHSFPMSVLTVTNYEEMRRQPDIFFGQLQPGGFLIINHASPPETLWRELVATYPEEVRQAAVSLRERFWATNSVAQKPTATGSSAAGSPSGGRGLPDVAEVLEETSRLLWNKPLARLTQEQQRLARKIAAMVCARVATVDMDGIMREVTGSHKVVSNLVAVAPMFQALQEVGFPFEWSRDLPILTQGFPEAVLKNKKLLHSYYQAMEIARQRSGVRRGEPEASPRDAAAPIPVCRLEEDPGEHLMLMGGTLAGMVLSQIATAQHPLFYIGFPITPAGNPFYAMADAFANGHPYIVIDEVNPSEKVAAEKLLGIARTGGFLPVTFTASQGWRLFTEIIPQFVGARLEGLFLIAKRALAAPNLNIEESHTDFMSFRDDGGIMLAPKSIQEYVPALYLARLLTHFAKIPVIVSIGGITDTHQIGLVKVPADDRVRDWLKRTLADFDFLEHKLLNRQGDLIVHGPSGTSAVYQETQSEIEKAHLAVTRIYPYAIQAVEELTGVRFGEIEATCAGGSEKSRAETVFLLQGSLYPNAVEALQELEEEGWSEMACLSVRCFNPFPEEKLFPWFESAERIVVLDRSNSFGSVPPLASRVFTAFARFASATGKAGRKQLRTLVGGLGGREITVREMREILLSTHLLWHPPREWETPLIERWLEEDATLKALLQEAAALDLRNTNRHTRVPEQLRSAEARRNEYQARLEQLQQLLAAKNYGPFLANYQQVEFIGPREVLQETELLQQIVLHLEIRLARHAIAAGQGGWRQALVLAHYSQEEEDHDRARSVLKKELESGAVSRRLAARYLQAGDVAEQVQEFEPAPGEQELAGEIRTEEALPGVKENSSVESASHPVMTFDLQEAERIETLLTRLVTLQGEEPLHFNPEDYEHELLRQLQGIPESPLHELRERLPADQADVLLWSYRRCYRDVIDQTLQREVLTQHHAPELRELFEGEGRKRLEELAGRLAVHLEELSPDERRKTLGEELERYLTERCLPLYPKSRLFYLEYFRNWVAPALIRER